MHQRPAKAQGKLLGRPKGALGKSRLDDKEQDIRVLLGKNVSKASIAKILDVSRSALYHFIARLERSSQAEHKARPALCCISTVIWSLP